ncbi:ubiquitin-like protein 3-like protein [Euroglyphus maynei]|uniref:Ubiquitin-like protein 3-like protein n=1 Tax=Euroglyphus maynei TaxID=6958 RepID=A0A1Y3BIN5_EURMA|nr:ubiquitin-like protein 3-like protein [Euroglyphus maynei]
MADPIPSDKHMVKVVKQKILYSHIAHYVFNHWPDDWTDQSVPKPEILRLIFQGRFLHGNVTLGILQLPLGKTTVMHLVPREHLPKVNSQGIVIISVR